MATMPTPNADAYGALESVLKDRYTAEHDRRDKINTSLALPTAIITALIGVVFYYAGNIPPAGTIFGVFFLIFFGAFVLFLVVSVGFMASAYHDRDPYAYLADPEAVTKHFKEWEEYHTLPDGTVEWDRVRLEHQKFMIEQYSYAAQINATYNDRKAFNVFHSRAWLMAALITLLLSVIPFFLSNPDVLKKPGRDSKRGPAGVQGFMRTPGAGDFLAVDPIASESP
jgi:hypothetical protein